ncbi:MAG: lipid-A-disaccharide synthase [bacterium]
MQTEGVSLPKKILVSAGDPSGDQLLSKIIKNINLKAPGEYEFWGLAGPLSQHEGVRLLVNSKDVAVVGLVEVLRNFKKIFGALNTLSSSLSESQSLICVDFPDFNFKLAQVAKKQGKPVDYIVAPQVWAWREGRIHTMKKWLRRLYPALPFEEGIFREQGVDARFMGHPLRDSLPPRNRRGAREILKIKENEKILALFPGSRKGEIRSNLPLMIDAWEQLKKYQEKWGLRQSWTGLLTLAPSWTLEELNLQLSSKYQRKVAELLKNDWKLSFQNHASLMASDFGWITSGTASLEAAYYQLPHVLMYKLNFFTVKILKALSNYFSDPNAFAGLPNILLEKRVIPELLQADLNPRRLAAETLDLLQDPHRLDVMKKHLRWIPKKLGESGVSERIADDLLQSWKQCCPHVQNCS